jgi:uncharacterized membrane protein YtjA (UPF0391 family)
MLRLALLFLIIAIVAGVLRLSEVAWLSMGLAQILFFVFLVLFVLSLIAGLGRGSPTDVV